MLPPALTGSFRVAELTKNLRYAVKMETQNSAERRNGPDTTDLTRDSPEHKSAFREVSQQKSTFTFVPDINVDLRNFRGLGHYAKCKAPTL